MSERLFVAGRVYADNDQLAHELIVNQIKNRGFDLKGFVRIKAVGILTSRGIWYEWRAEVKNAEKIKPE